MSLIKENFPLKNLNTFGIDVRARYFTRAGSVEELKQVLEDNRNFFPFMVIGGGSNILFTSDYNGLIIQPSMKGIKIIDNNHDHCMVEVGAGEDWDDFVSWSVENNLGGVENLSLIPGSTGSSPIQNIGAYGTELKDVVEKVNYLDLETFEMISINNRDCHFGYRASIFKNQLKNRVIITSVIFRLKHHPLFNTSYGNLHAETIRLGKISLVTIRNAVINIRRYKLPDPKLLGNAGSFFKNPVVETAKALELKDRYTSMPQFPASDLFVKIPAGWLIEQCGWKGRRTGNAGVHDKQALVLVNFGNATGYEIKALAMKIRDSVLEKFDINLEPEVNII